MKRGVYDFLREMSSYSTARKVWYIELLEADYFSFDLITNPPDQIDAESLISNHLKKKKKRVEKTIERRFVYFICSRPKIRFDLRMKPYYDLGSGYLKMHLLVGKEEVKKVAIICEGDSPEKFVLKKFEMDENYIRFFDEDGSSVKYSTQQMLDTFNIHLGHSTKVHYVGVTKDPHTRPLKRKHRGLADVFLNVSNEENEFYLVMNLFKASTYAINDQAGILFQTSNALTDEIPVRPEGEIIEKAFVAYFDSPFQKESQSHERASLKKHLESLRSDHNVDFLIVDYDYWGDDQYLEFSSERVEAADRHVFSYTLNDEGIYLERLPIDFDVRQFVQMQF